MDTQDFKEYMLVLFRESKGREPTEREAKLLDSDLFKQMYLDLAEGNNPTG